MVAKTIIPNKTSMAEQPPEVRVCNFYEVPYGYTPKQAIAEAKRCLDCPKQICVPGCPVNVDIPAFLKLVALGDFLGAAKLIKQTNALPAITGRVCPQENQCEGVCALAKRYEPVAIGRLERFVADWEAVAGSFSLTTLPPPTHKNVAVVGCCL